MIDDYQLFKNINISNPVSKVLVDRVTESNEESFLFCKITKSSLVYLKNAKWGLLAIDYLVDELESFNNIIVLEDKFEEVKKRTIDSYYPKTSTKLIGITGTNGKTTISHLAMQIASKSGHKSIAIGTNGVMDINGFLCNTGNTTLGYLELRKILNVYKEYEYAFIELSSHGLIQDRLGDLRLIHAAWSNFTQDHLDYHKSMDEYFEAKLLIFRYLDGKLVVPHMEEYLINRLPASILLTKEYSGKTKFVGFNKSNLEVAISLNKLLGIDFDESLDLKLPEGRFQEIKRGNGVIIIDYAHTPMALQNLVTAVKDKYSKKIKLLFGCGGNRDRSKREKMGMAGSIADFLYITSDNPRNENQMDIINDILPGVSTSYEVIPDRKEAIRKGVLELGEDVLIIAGKGHEKYQEINNIKYDFSDLEVVNEIKFSY